MKIKIFQHFVDFSLSGGAPHIDSLSFTNYRHKFGIFFIFENMIITQATKILVRPDKKVFPI